MINKIMDGISIKLNQVFGDGKEIYADKDVQQGLKEPCFFIAVLNPSQNQMIGSRYFREHPFDVHYFPKTKGNNIELHEVGSELFDALEYITLPNDDLVRGTSMRYEVVSGVLHFFVNFNMFVEKEQPFDPMEEFSIDANA